MHKDKFIAIYDIGEKICQKDWADEDGKIDWLKILGIGQSKFLAVDSTGYETSWDFHYGDGDWILYKSPKKKVKKWLWIFKDEAGNLKIDNLFLSIKEAKRTEYDGELIEAYGEPIEAEE